MSASDQIARAINYLPFSSSRLLKPVKARFDNISDAMVEIQRRLGKEDVTLDDIEFELAKINDGLEQISLFGSKEIKQSDAVNNSKQVVSTFFQCCHRLESGE